jgi:hypothetical protein
MLHLYIFTSDYLKHAILKKNLSGSSAAKIGGEALAYPSLFMG